MALSFPSYKAFTLKSKARLISLKTEVLVSQPIIGEDFTRSDDPRFVKAMALWDTGATVSCISRTLAEKMNLIVSGRANASHAKGSSVSDIFVIDIVLPNNLRIPLIDALEIENVDGKFDIIIGMNIISQGDFAITNADNTTTFSFRIPSIKTIDYVQEGKDSRIKAYSKLNRNDRCLCGSNKKYKDCCESMITKLANEKN